jgi:hypothetical protein
MEVRILCTYCKGEIKNGKTVCQSCEDMNRVWDWVAPKQKKEDA